MECTNTNVGSTDKVMERKNTEEGDLIKRRCQEGRLEFQMF
jgi:hypothetical protein